MLRVLLSAKMLLFCAEDRAQGCNFVEKSKELTQEEEEKPELS